MKTFKTKVIFNAKTSKDLDNSNTLTILNLLNLY